ncbi:MAG: hypothetical protein F4Y58_02370 [Gammaproteobacteria bacterium]|nr:hypothetical protein [Gammaproteobacteria bacterium]
MTLFVPGLLKIKGKRCLILADSVSHELPASGTVLLERVAGFNIFCLAEELVEKKAAHHGIPVYGYWQTLYASKQWQPDSGIAAYRHNNIGQYVAVDSDEKTAITGEVVDGHAVATVGEQFNQEQVCWLEISTADIVLPSQSAMTIAERIARQENNNRTILAMGSFAALALILGVMSGSWFADNTARRLDAQREILIAEVEHAQIALAKLKETKLVAVPNQQDILNLLEALSWVEGIEIENSKMDAIQLSVPYQSYTDMIYVLAQHDIPYTEQWLAEGRVQVSLR